MKMFLVQSVEVLTAVAFFLYRKKDSPQLYLVMIWDLFGPFYFFFSYFYCLINWHHYVFCHVVTLSVDLVACCSLKCVFYFCARTMRIIHATVHLDIHFRAVVHSVVVALYNLNQWTQEQNTWIFVVDGLRARIVDVWPSCHICEMWMCGIRAIYVLSAIESAFFAGFGNLPVQGRFCRNFVLIVLFFFFCRAGPAGGDSEHLGTAPPRHCTVSPLRQ